jgi:flagellin-like hook-associated protein FlgL
MGLRPQTYDAFAAYDTGRQNEQTFRTNQMAMQAAQATAARNAMIRERAATVDYGDPNSVNEFARLGPETTAYIQAAGAGDTLFNTRAAETRSQGEFDIKRNEASMAELRTVVGRVFNNPDDASLADAAQRYPQFAADINRIAANPDAAARRNGLATLVASLPGGSDFLKAVTENYVRTNMGDRSIVDQTNPYAPGFTPPVEQRYGKNPNPVIVQTSQGIGSVVPGEPGFTPATNPDGTPVMPYVAPRAAPATDALGTQAASATTLRDVLGQLRTNFDVLYREGFMRGGGVSPVGNVAQFVGDAIPGVRGARLSANSAADTASGNVESLLSTAISTLSALYGTSSRVMDAVKEMENARSTFGGQRLTIEAARNMVDTALRRVDELEASRVDGGGDVSALEAEARRRGLIP